MPAAVKIECIGEAKVVRSMMESLAELTEKEGGDSHLDDAVCGQVPREDVAQRLAREERLRTFDVDFSRKHGQCPDPLVSSSGGRVEGIPCRTGDLVCGSLSR